MKFGFVDVGLDSSAGADNTYVLVLTDFCGFFCYGNEDAEDFARVFVFAV